jgi:uncharacterized protein (TIGR04562 family)
MDKSDLAELWKFPWPVMDVLIGGQSSLDLPEMRVATYEDATEFTRSYGFDPDSPRDACRLHGLLIEAVAFIERQLLLPREWQRGVRPPDELLACEDPRHLLLWASSRDPESRLSRAWACAVLRVMHTIAHLEGVNRAVDVGIAREQIFSRFRAHLTRDADRRLWLGDGAARVELANIEWKESKGRDSIILKLLHKRDNVAETIFDVLGVRIVTKRLCDVMMVVKCLRQFNMVVYPNAYPSRARNNLIDTKRFRTQVETLREMLLAGTLSPAEFEDMIGRLSASVPLESVTPTNPHSAQSYRAVQLTGRQLITVKNHRFEWLDKLRRAIDTQKLPAATARVLGELEFLVEGWHSVKDNLDVAAFFPFEVQILDAESYSQALSGDANHSRYKLSQVRAARQRVLQQVLELSRQSPV